MATIIRCNCNAGMERFFKSKVNISNNINFDVFFDLTNPNTTTEKRQLRIVNRATGGLLLLVDLNDKGGLKPLKGLTKQYKPRTRSNPRLNQSCDIEIERVFYAETNLINSRRTKVIFRIITDTPTTDRRHFLSLSSTESAFPAILQDQEIDLNGDGGKKPLEGGLEFKEIHS